MATCISYDDDAAAVRDDFEISYFVVVVVVVVATAAVLVSCGQKVRRRDCSVVQRSSAATHKRLEAEVGRYLLHAILSQFSAVAVSATPRTTSRRLKGGETRREKQTNKQHA